MVSAADLKKLIFSRFESRKTENSSESSDRENDSVLSASKFVFNFDLIRHSNGWECAGITDKATE